MISGPYSNDRQYAIPQKICQMAYFLDLILKHYGQ